MSQEAPLPLGVSPLAPSFEGAVQTSGVMFAVPAYGGIVHPATRRGLRDARRALQERGIPVSWVQVINQSIVQWARNECVAHFLASPASHLLFVDADMGFTGGQVLRLLAHDRDLIGAICRRKTLATRSWTGRALDHSMRRDPRTGAVEMEAIGTAFMMIHRRVFERMRAAWPELRYQTMPGAHPPEHWQSHLAEYFAVERDVASASVMSEDYVFCRRWRSLGGEVWADPALLVQHWGYLPPEEWSLFDDAPPAAQDICFAGDPLADMLAEEAAARGSRWP